MKLAFNTSGHILRCLQELQYLQVGIAPSLHMAHPHIEPFKRTTKLQNTLKISLTMCSCVLIVVAHCQMRIAIKLNFK